MTEKTQASDQKFAIQRLYVKDMSFEAPSTPEIFQQEWKPEMHLDLHTHSKKLDEDDNSYEVTLTLTVTVKSNDKNAFVCEVKQAGIFSIEGLTDDQLSHTLGSFCPNLLYPYGREAISAMVNRGGFPQLILAPVNFDALYQQHLQEAEKQKETDGTEA